MLSQILISCFYLLFFLTPFLWAPWNFELFEYNKMMFVYLLTVIVACTWLLKMITERSLIFKKTPLNIPLLLFLLANILSTIFSIDPHTSIWGYYSRSNGGLLSTISYIVLYFALVSNFNSAQALKFLKASVISGLIVSLWAIPEHFGVSPSCVLLSGSLTDSCWIQDVQARVFATLGQPNWLAAYLAMLIFPSFYFTISSKKPNQKLAYLLITTIMYLAFTFTYSRGGTLGLIAGVITFLVLTFGALTLSKKIEVEDTHFHLTSFSLLTLGLFFAVNVLFGSSLTDFKLVSLFAAPSRPNLSISQVTASPSASVGTQLENGGTESGTIRLIVWQGALDIFKHNPIFGSGVETFAYSYYQYRPAAHNLVSEWDFLYNKAHNEFLNYLSTTGIVGFSTYMAIIIIFGLWSLRKIFTLSYKDNLKLQVILAIILAAYVSYLVQNFFSFSVVTIAVFFFLFPGFSFILAGSVKEIETPQLLVKLGNAVYKRRIYSTLLISAVCIIGFLLTLEIILYYVADTFYAKGYHLDEIGNSGKAYNNLLVATFLNPREPLYQSEQGYAAAGAALAASTDDATLSAKLKNEAVEDTENSLRYSPKNVSLLRTAIRTYYILSGLDQSFIDKTLATIDRTEALAPTDPKLTYNKALILAAEKRNNEAITELEKTIALKPNYRDAHFTLGLLYFDQGEKDKATNEMLTVLKIIPGDPDATEKLATWTKSI